MDRGTATADYIMEDPREAMRGYKNIWRAEYTAAQKFCRSAVVQG